MRLPWRSRYHDVIERQLVMFADDHRPLLVRISDAKRRYERARGTESEEAYGDYELQPFGPSSPRILLVARA